MAQISPPPPPPPMAQISPPPPPPPSPKNLSNPTHRVHKTLASAANLANLLPTGTVLAFRTLAPSFSNKGFCQSSNKYLTSWLIIFCAIICFFSSFTDSFINHDGKFYYGIATFKGFHIFNRDIHDDDDDGDYERSKEYKKDLSNMRFGFIDFVHAFVSLFVFLINAVSDSDVQRCFFPNAGSNINALVMNLPLGAGIFSSFLFMVFPTTRRGIGYADTPFSPK